jgi:hypothetical protein
MDMTLEEMQNLVKSTNLNVQINILNKVADRPKFKDDEPKLLNEVITGDRIDNIVPDMNQVALISARRLHAGLPDGEPEMFELPTPKKDDDDDEILEPII